jgi:hypothetical protein
MSSAGRSSDGAWRTFCCWADLKEETPMQILDYESDSRRWRAWFAWYPLLINGQSVWLRTVQRRPEYREIAGVTQQYWVYRIPRVGRGKRAMEQ